MAKLGCLLLISLFSAAAFGQDAGPEYFQSRTSQTVTVIGEVFMPGTLDIPASGLNLMQALVLSGGLLETANPEIEILRPTDREAANYRINGVHVQYRVMKRIRVNLKDVLAGKATNVSLEAGDSIRIPKIMALVLPNPSILDRI